MIKKTITISIFIFLTICVKSQTINRRLPLPLSTTEYLSNSSAPIVQTSDGGYLLNYCYGHTSLKTKSPNLSEIIKTDTAFVPLWRKELTGENGKKTFSFNDGTSIIYATGDGVDIEKINNAGQTLWIKKYSRSYPYSFFINDAINYNGNIKLAGYVSRMNGFGLNDYTKALILDIDTAGNFVHADSLIISSFTNTDIQSLTKDASGNCYIMGSGMGSNGNSFIAKISSSNSVVWCKNLYVSGNAPFFYSSTIMSNGDLLIGGSIFTSNLAATAINLLRFTSAGLLVWSKTISYPSFVGGVNEFSNGDILVTGLLSTTYGDTIKNIIIKLDPNGNPLWTRRYNKGSHMSPIYQKNNNSWYFASFTSDPIVFNTDSSGNSLCPSTNFALVFNNLPLTITSLTCSLNSINISSSSTSSNVVNSQAYVDTCSNFLNTNFNINKSNNIVVYPNPTNGSVSILSDRTIDEIKVSNLLGQTIYNATPNDIKYSFNLDNSGIYFIAITSGKQISIQKLIKVE